MWLGIILGVCICIFLFRVGYENFAAATPAAPATAATPATPATAATARPATQAQTPVPDEMQTALQTIHTSIPLMDMKMINTLKTMLNNIIVQRPDVIEAINYVFSDPQIHKTLVQMLFVLKQQ